MKKVSKVLYGSLVSVLLLLGGCGAGSDVTDTELVLPHDGSRSFRALSQDRDWTWNVDMHFSVTDFAKEPYTLKQIVIECYDGIPDNVKHLQFFINTDNNISTGFTGTNGWHVSGADYLIEDGELFESQSNSSWKWKSLGKIQSYRKIADDNAYAKIVMKIGKKIPVAPRIDMSIEPYNGKWNGIYDTVYPLGAVAENIAFVNNTLKDIFKKILGDDFITLDETKIDNRAVVTRKLNGYKAYVLYDTSSEQQPQELGTIAQSDATSTIKALRILDAQKLSYALQDGGKNYQVVYDYAALHELSRTEMELLTPEALTRQLTEMGTLDTQTESFVYVTSDTQPKYVLVAIYTRGDMHDVKRYGLFTLSDSGEVTFVKNLDGIHAKADISTLRITDNHTLQYKELAANAQEVPKVHRYDFIEGKEIGEVSVDVVDQIKAKFIGHYSHLKEIWFSPDQKYALIHIAHMHTHSLNVINIENPNHIYEVKSISNRPYTFSFSDVKVDNQYVSYVETRKVNNTVTQNYFKYRLADGEQVEKSPL